MSHLCADCHAETPHTSLSGVAYAWCLSCILKRGAITLKHPDGQIEVLYAPTDKLKEYHASTCPNLLAEGTRGTGKSTAMRWDAHMRALGYPGYTYLILRRTMPELKKSHLHFIDAEMRKLGGFYHHTDNIAIYNNGSRGYFGHCETDADVMKYLSAQFCAIYFDEITTFDWDMVVKIAASARVPEGSGLIAIVRAGTNPLGVSAEEVYRYYIGKDVMPDEDPEYNPADWQNIHLTLDDNPYLDQVQYRKRFAGLPEAYQKAWLQGLWGVEGAYFSLMPEHSIKDIPTVADADGNRIPALRCPWLHVYRALDWGWHKDDPAYCVWIAVFPNGREIPFKVKQWTYTPATVVAKEIVNQSDGMRVVTTFADPTMWSGMKEMGHCIADDFENNGVALTKAKNDRTAAGYAIQEHLNTLLDDKQPKLQFHDSPSVEPLVRAMRAMRIDKNSPGRIADHKQDHGPICLGYFCMAGVGPTQVPRQARVPLWMVPKRGKSRILGSAQVRTRN